MIRLAISAAVYAGLAIGAAASALADVVEYAAEYEVTYKGRHVAQAEFSVARTSMGRYEFRSSTRARGIWRVASPNAATEFSEFELRSGRIAPLRFEYEDGSRKGEDNFSIDFDAPAGEIRVSSDDGQQTLAFDEGLLDRGSLQVAMMADVGSCQLPASYRYVDDDGARQYRYERLEDRVAESEAGDFSTVRLSQQREGSSRITVLWLAPDLAYLPVRIEQIRDGEVETVFSLESVSGIESTSGCSSLG